MSPGGYIFQRPFWRGLCTEGNLHSKIDWASLYWERNLPFSLCFTLYSRENSTYNPPGGLCSEWRFNGGFFCVTIWGSYFRNFTGNLLISFLLKISVFSVYFSLPFCYWSAPDPDLKIRGGWGGLPKDFFWPFGPQFGPQSPEIRGGGGRAPPPGSATADCWFLSFFFCLIISASVVICLRMCLILSSLFDWFSRPLFFVLSSFLCIMNCLSQSFPFVFIFNFLS